MYALVKRRYLAGAKAIGGEAVPLPLANLLSTYHLTGVNIMTLVTGHIDQAIARSVKLFARFQQISHRAIRLHIDGFTDCPVTHESFQGYKIRMVDRQCFAGGVPVTATADALLQGHDICSFLAIHRIAGNRPGIQACAILTMTASTGLVGIRLCIVEQLLSPLNGEQPRVLEVIILHFACCRLDKFITGFDFTRGRHCCRHRQQGTAN